MFSKFVLGPRGVLFFALTIALLVGFGTNTALWEAPAVAEMGVLGYLSQAGLMAGIWQGSNPDSDTTDWPMSGYDLQNTNYNRLETVLEPPLTEVPGWEISFPSDVSPESMVIYEGVILVSEAHDEGPNSVSAHDEPTGRFLWRFTLDPESGGAVGSTPAVQDGVAYFGGQGPGFFAVDITRGSQFWKFVSDPGHYPHLYGSNPKVSRDKVYFQDLSGIFYALDKDSGRAVWSFDANSQQSTPALSRDGSTVYISSNIPYRGGAGDLVALDAETAPRVKWTSPEEGVAFGAIAVSESLIFVGANVQRRDPDCPQCGVDTIKAFDSHGALRWQYSTDADYLSDFAVANDILVVELRYSDRARDNTLLALDAQTGTFLWEFDVAKGWSTPVVANGIIYHCDGSKLYALEARSGRVIWEEEGPFSSPIVANGALYAISGRYGGTIHKFQRRDIGTTFSIPYIVANAEDLVGQQVQVEGYFGKPGAAYLITDYNLLMVNSEPPEHTYLILLGLPDDFEAEKQEGAKLKLTGTVNMRFGREADPAYLPGDSKVVTLEAIGVWELLRPSERLPWSKIPIPDPLVTAPRAKDCSYVVIISGGGNANYDRYWHDIILTYWTMKSLDYKDNQIYVLYYDGKPKKFKGKNIINYGATKANITKVFNQIAGDISGNKDCEVLIFTTNHGSGYHVTEGYGGGRLDANGDETTSIKESDFRFGEGLQLAQLVESGCGAVV